MPLLRNDKTFTYAEYTMNCQRSVIAYELRRRGYDVYALPTYQGDKLPSRLKNGNGYWMGAFRGAKSVSVGGESIANTKKNISSKMNSWGNGSRAVVRVRWSGKNGGGHVFNAENVNGKIRYVDAQTGKRVDIESYLGDSITSKTQLVRTDNLRISERAKKSVTTKRY